MTETLGDDRLILLNTEDNVFVTRVRLQRGDSVLIGDQQCLVSTDILPGFKVARRFLSVGTTIIKCGAPIGSATKDIPLGQMVHTDNMKGDYIAIHLNEPEGASAHLGGNE